MSTLPAGTSPAGSIPVGAATWEDRYREAWPRLPERLQAVKGVVLGFHSVVDGLQRVDPAWLEPLLADPQLMAEVERRRGEVPAALDSPADLILALLESLRTGKALQRMIRREELFRWMLEKIGYQRPRLGGTSGNMANALAPLGVPLLVYAYPLSRQLADLFVPLPNLTVLVEEEGRIRLVPPGQVAAPDDLRALHLIIEYPQGFPVRFGQTVFATPRANRFIAGWNPTNSQLRIAPAFRRGVLAEAGRFSHFILSGFHILAERYADGTTFRECLRPVAEFCRELKGANPALRLHCEFASLGSPLIRREVLDAVLPAVDSLGLNEVELVTLLEAAGEEGLAARLRAEEAPAAVLEGLRVLLARGRLSRIHLHNLGYYLVLARPGYGDPVAAREALLLTAALAAARTALGRTGAPGELAVGLEQPLSPRGLGVLAGLAAHLADPAFATSGLSRYAGYEVACVPTRVVANPVLTVGLGDLISSAAFVLDRPGDGKE
jgi:ADP-dependent phosphofructokinase/glucokinase